MKYLMAAFLTLTYGLLTANAQTIGSQELNESRLNLTLDFDHSSILKSDFNDWVKNEPDWELSLNEIRVKFIQAFNEEASHGQVPHRVGDYPDADYVLRVIIGEVSDKGSEVHADIHVYNRYGIGGPLMKDVEAEKGVFGSTANLMGDALGRMGEIVGKEFKNISFNELFKSDDILYKRGDYLRLGIKMEKEDILALLGKDAYENQYLKAQKTRTIGYILTIQGAAATGVGSVLSAACLAGSSADPEVSFDSIFTKISIGLTAVGLASLGIGFSLKMSGDKTLKNISEKLNAAKNKNRELSFSVTPCGVGFALSF